MRLRRDALGMLADTEPLSWTTRISLDLNYLAQRRSSAATGGDPRDPLTLEVL